AAPAAPQPAAKPAPGSGLPNRGAAGPGIHRPGAQARASEPEQPEQPTQPTQQRWSTASLSGWLQQSGKNRHSGFNASAVPGRLRQQK
nr:hypothetical protein [Tanacetum cinerariifolium]